MEILTKKYFLFKSKNCTVAQDFDSCLKLEEYEKVLKENDTVWNTLVEAFTMPTLGTSKGNLLPYCSYVSNSLEMERCDLFQEWKSEGKVKKEQCFTFNQNGSFQADQAGEQLNVLVNFELVGSNFDKNSVVRAFIHQQNDYPNLVDSNYISIKPGSEISITMNPTVKETSEAFDSMPEWKRQCKPDMDYRKVLHLAKRKFYHSHGPQGVSSSMLFAIVMDFTGIFFFGFIGRFHLNCVMLAEQEILC